MRHQGRACHRRYTAGGGARGRAHAQVVPRLRPRDRGRPRGHRLRARLARDDRLPGQAADARRASSCCATASTCSRRCPNATIYIEAGASDWEPAARTAKLLRLIGIAKVRGFMLNVTHYDWTANNIRHGLRHLEPRGGQAVHHLDLVQRSRAGALPALDQPPTPPLAAGDRLVPSAAARPRHRSHDPDPPPQGRRLLLHRPARATPAVPATAARCRSARGSEKRALMFGRCATNWIRPPRGTRFGHPRGLSLKAVAGDQLSR